MSQTVYRYVFDDAVPTAEIEGTLLLAILAVESLHGESQTRLDAAHALESGGRIRAIDANTPGGRDLNRLFVGYARREFGPDSFTVERVGAAQPATA